MYRHLARDDRAMVFPLAVTFLWPVAMLALSRVRVRAWLSILAPCAEPLLAAVSTLLIPWIWLILPARPDIGVLVAVGANGLYALGWLAGLLSDVAGDS